MARKLLSFLGMGNYTEVIVSYGETRSRPTCFITESLADIFCKDWNEEDEIVVFVTETSENKHWLSSENKEGLNDRLKRMSEKYNWRYRSVRIPEGKNVAELWGIFDKIYNVLNPNDTVILDITHGFRSIPMLCSIVLNYARFLKNIKIDSIVYGALEALGRRDEVEALPVEKRIVPLFDLTLFQQLFDWTHAAKEFLTTGSTYSLSQLGKEEVRSLFGYEDKRSGAKKLRKLFVLLECFRKEVETCRGPQIKATIESIHEVLEKTETELEDLPAFLPIYRKLNAEFKQLDSLNEINAIHTTVKWCTKNGLIQQAITLLRENIINYLMVSNNQLDLRDIDERRKVENLLNDSETQDIFPSELVKLWRYIVQFRNDINHAGYRPITDYRKAEKFKDYLYSAIKNFEEIIKLQ